MTPTDPTPNFTQNLIRIHKVITRGLNVAKTKGAEYVKSGLPKPEVLLGYAHYAHSLASFLGAHHESEDKVAFPALRIKLPSVPYNLLTANHHEIELLLVVINQAVADLSANVPEEGLRVLVENLAKVLVIWEEHIYWEERHFSQEAVAPVFDLDEQRRISEAIGKYSQDHAEPPYWVIPFVLFNLEPEDRSVMAATLPPMVVNELVPKTWKDQWVSMKPFLLD